MSGLRERGEDVRRYIVENVERHPHDIAKRVAEKFSISRQAANKHLKRLIAEKALIETGTTRKKAYKLFPLVTWGAVYERSERLAEDLVWRDAILPVLGRLPDNVINIWHYGFTEMFNNAIDHSEAAEIYIQIKKTAASTQMLVADNGVGIFRKIQIELKLLDERHAVLELSKGKLTTDPARHSGEGIFFSSRMFDSFDISSGGVYFTHKFGDDEDWILESGRTDTRTLVWMKLNNHTARTTKRIFDQYTSGDQYGFNKTIVPVKLAQYGNDNLISRSQAKRLLARVELFKIVIFDFKGVAAIGQAFADEIFRVFAMQHPEIELTSVNENADVSDMIKRALVNRR